VNPFRRHPDTAPILAPPPLLFAACLLGGYGLERLWPVPLLELPVPVRLTAGLVPLGLSLALGLWAIPLFRAHGTPVDPGRPTTGLILRGPYRFTRNPLYLALLSAFTGFVFLLGSVWVLLLLPVLALLLHFGVVKREEAYLETKFGEAYRAYRAAVRRWV